MRKRNDAKRKIPKQKEKYGSETKQKEKYGKRKEVKKFMRNFRKKRRNRSETNPVSLRLKKNVKQNWRTLV